MADLYSAISSWQPAIPAPTGAKRPKKAAASKGGKAAKKDKAPRALSGYMRFCAAERPAIMKAHPDWKVTEVAKALGAQWKTASAATKKKYNDAYEKEKEKLASK